jgi:uncharacterized protein (TIGR00251 family)
MAEIGVRVITRAQRDEIAGERGGRLLIRLAAPPVDGAANDALIAFLSTALDIPRRQIAIVSGEKSRDKRVRIAGIETAAAATRLLR